MTASTPQTDFDQLWLEHKMNVRATGEIAEQADRQMKALITTLKAYRLHKKRCSTEIEVDYGHLAHLIVELELTVETC